MGRTVTKKHRHHRRGRNGMVLFRFSKDCVSLSFQGRSGFSAAQRHQSCFETGRILFEQAIRLYRMPV